METFTATTYTTQEEKMAESKLMAEFIKMLESRLSIQDPAYITAYKAGYFESFLESLMLDIPEVRKVVEDRLKYMKKEA
jgi:hypothetical protein